MPQEKSSPSIDPVIPETTLLVDDLRQLISQARARVALYVNQEMTLLYWDIGQRIYTETLREERAEYGQKIVATLSQQLIQEFGHGFNYSAITRMVKFPQAFPARPIVATLSEQLS